MIKLTKQESGYYRLGIHNATKGHSCLTCKFMSKSNSSCSKVEGVISLYASCNLWSDTGRINLDFISGNEAHQRLIEKNRLSKLEAGFVCEIREQLRPGPTEEAFECASCKHYHGDRKSCFPVKGKIDEHACCNLFNYDAEDPPTYLSGEQVREKLGTAILDIENLGCMFK